MPYRWAGSSQHAGHGPAGSAPAAPGSSSSFNVNNVIREGISTGETGYDYGASTSAPRFDDKLLPPGAGIRPVQLNEAASERDSLDRALHASKEQAEVEELLRRSRLEEEEANAARQRELEAEEAILQESKRLHEDQLDHSQIAELEEQEALRKAIEASEREASRAIKGKSSALAIRGDGDSSDAELQRVMEMSKTQTSAVGRSPIPTSPSSHSSRQPSTSAQPPLPPRMATRARRPLPVPPALETTSLAIPAHVVNQTSDDEGDLSDAPPMYERVVSSAKSSEAEAVQTETVQKLADDQNNKRLCFYPPVAPEMVEGSMRVVVPHMLFATRARQASDDYLPMTSRDLDPADLPPASADIMSLRPSRPVPPPPVQSQASSSKAVTEGTSDSGYRGDDNRHDENDVEEDGDPFHDRHLYTPAPEDEDDNSHYRYQVSSLAPEDGNGQDAEISEAHVGRHDYARSSIASDGMPRAVSPQPMQEETSYDTDQSGGSFESAASDTEGEDSSQIPESPKSINHNVSFGFNPLSSPTQHLDWQGRFPDVVVLSKYSDEPGEGVSSRQDLNKQDYTTFAFEAPTWRELIAYLMWHGNSLFQASPLDVQEAGSSALRVSLVVEFIKEHRPTTYTLVRLQVHLLDDSQGAPSGTRGVSLSRKPLSSRPVPQPQASQKNIPNSSSFGSLKSPTEHASPSHLVFAFPKPLHSLPLTLSTIGTYLHNAHKAALAAKNHTIPTANSHQFTSNAFLLDLARGIEMCTNSSDTKDNEDKRVDSLMQRLRTKRHRIKGTFRDLHKRSRRRRRGERRDSQDSTLESQPLPEDYHITPFRADL